MWDFVKGLTFGQKVSPFRSLIPIVLELDKYQSKKKGKCNLFKN